MVDKSYLLQIWLVLFTHQPHFFHYLSECSKISLFFKYYGSHFGSTEKDLNTRIALAWVAFARLNPLLKASRPIIKFNMRLLNAACISIVLYGCESWVLTEPLKKSGHIRQDMLSNYPGLINWTGGPYEFIWKSIWKTRNYKRKYCSTQFEIKSEIANLNSQNGQKGNTIHLHLLQIWDS